jgi:hypothetical protein
MSKKAQYPTVLVVIVNFNGRNLLDKHLQSVLDSDYPVFDVVVVDNASSDGSIKYLKSNFSSIKILRLDRNYGFGKANNAAFEQYAQYKYYALVNNDMSVSPDWLKKLVAVAEEDSDVAAVGPKILYSKKKNDKYLINSAGMVLDQYYRGIDRFCGEINNFKYNTLEEVDAVTGGAVLLRAEAIREVGGFDDRMFFYYEDVDLSLRLKSAGWKIMYNGEVEVFHDHQATSAKLHSNFDMNFKANLNRIKSIQSRQGVVAAVREAFRSSLEWLFCKISGQSLKKRVYDNISKRT